MPTMAAFHIQDCSLTFVHIETSRKINGKSFLCIYYTLGLGGRGMFVQPVHGLVWISTHSVGKQKGFLHSPGALLSTRALLSNTFAL